MPPPNLVGPSEMKENDSFCHPQKFPGKMMELQHGFGPRVSENSDEEEPLTPILINFSDSSQVIIEALLKIEPVRRSERVRKTRSIGCKRI